MAENTQATRILIAGAGIAGLATAVALARVSDLPNIDVQLYEQASELLEIGASIALSPNGMRTLEKLGVDNALTDETGFRSASGIPQIFRHWKTNQVISVDTHINVPDPRHHTTRFHRGHIHSALLEHVPKESIHLGKKLIRAEATDAGVSLFFEDGTSAHGDILIGADGIKSKVRQSFIPEYKLRFGGRVFMRATFNAALVEGKIPDLPADSMHWWGPNDNFFASKLGKNQYTTVGAYSDPRSSEEIENSVAWDQKGDVTFLRERYKGWNPVVRALTEATPYTNLYPNFTGDRLRTWVFGSRVTLIGDAAHAHGGAFAAGGSLALDDAFALGLAFRHVGGISSPEKIESALKLYESVRQTHTDRLLRVVHGLLDTSKKAPAAKSAEEEDARLIERLRSRPATEWLSEYDVEREFAHVVKESEGGEKQESYAGTSPVSGLQVPASKL
ncbi:hypothetical protein BJY01DRAFT_262717 [Aspergillus pseudoustus]|uniref:FAD-binding domain-containing protein n=1 Tax=Aspergillus pseudoustus TaxID=1810923 RepID=A0ABR4K7Y3_9EURO